MFHLNLEKAKKLSLPFIHAASIGFFGLFSCLFTVMSTKGEDPPGLGIWLPLQGSELQRESPCSTNTH